MKFTPKYKVGDMVHYKSPTDGHYVVGEIEIAWIENGVDMYGIHHPCYGYETVSILAITHIVSEW